MSRHSATCVGQVPNRWTSLFFHFFFSFQNQARCQKRFKILFVGRNPRCRIGATTRFSMTTLSLLRSVFASVTTPWRSQSDPSIKIAFCRKRRSISITRFRFFQRKTDLMEGIPRGICALVPHSLALRDNMLNPIQFYSYKSVYNVCIHILEKNLIKKFFRFARVVAITIFLNKQRRSVESLW